MLKTHETENPTYKWCNRKDTPYRREEKKRRKT